MIELYTYALPGAPFLVVAFAILWLVASAFAVVIMFRMIKLDGNIQALQESVDRQLGKSGTGNKDKG